MLKCLGFWEYPPVDRKMVPAATAERIPKERLKRLVCPINIKVFINSPPKRFYWQQLFFEKTLSHLDPTQNRHFAHKYSVL